MEVASPNRVQLGYDSPISLTLIGPKSHRRLIGIATHQFKKWAAENGIGHYTIRVQSFDAIILDFENVEDAMLCKLTWVP